MDRNSILFRIRLWWYFKKANKFLSISQEKIDKKFIKKYGMNELQLFDYLTDSKDRVMDLSFIPNQKEK